MNTESKALLASMRDAAAKDATWAEWDALIQELPSHLLRQLAEKASTKLDEETREWAHRARTAEDLTEQLVDMCTATEMAARGEASETSWDGGIGGVVRVALMAREYAELMAAVIKGREPRWTLEIRPNCLRNWEHSLDDAQ